MNLRYLIPVAALCAAAGFAQAAAVPEPAPRGMPFEIFIRLEHGMTEGELVLRAGKPDHQSFDNLREGLKTLYYYPTPANPFLTTVALRSGRIANIERLRKGY